MVRVRHWGITVLAILSYIGAFFSFLCGLFLIFNNISLLSYILQTNPLINIFFVDSLIVFMGVLIIAYGILDLFVGIGLWKGKKWARIVLIVMMAAGILAYLANIATEWVGIIISAIIIWYIGFYKPAVRYFR